MQIANCFGKVQDAMSYFVDVYASLAEWQSCAERLLSFDKHIAAIEKETEEKSGNLVREETPDRLRLTDITISVPAMDENKRTREIISSASCSIKAGEHVILKGPSGSGKSTLLRTLAGFWPYVKGHISMPAPSEMMFIPQKPYIPMGTSAEAASYPLETADKEILSPLLVECGLSHLMEKRIPRRTGATSSPWGNSKNWLLSACSSENRNGSSLTKPPVPWMKKQKKRCTVF